MTTIMIENEQKQMISDYVERIVSLEKEKKILLDDIREIYSEAESNDIDVKALREVVKVILKQKSKEQVEEEMLKFDTYFNFFFKYV